MNRRRGCGAKVAHACGCFGTKVAHACGDLGVRRLIFACEQRTFKVPTLQPNLSAIAGALRPCSTNVGMPAITSLVRMCRISFVVLYGQARLIERAIYL